MALTTGNRGHINDVVDIGNRRNSMAKTPTRGGATNTGARRAPSRGADPAPAAGAGKPIDTEWNPHSWFTDDQRKQFTRLAKEAGMTPGEFVADALARIEMVRKPH
jgi:hypothetical protein